jgi:hypothetical protein
MKSYFDAGVGLAVSSVTLDSRHLYPQFEISSQSRRTSDHVKLRSRVSTNFEGENSHIVRRIQLRIIETPSRET